MTAGGSLLVLTALLGGALRLIAAGLAGVVMAVFVPQAVRAVRALPATARFGKVRAPGPVKDVHSGASTLPGAGAELLGQLAAEADMKGWSLYLDASNENLARYYRAFGFRDLGVPVGMPDGSSAVRMWRPPSTPTAAGGENAALAKLP